MITVNLIRWKQKYVLRWKKRFLIFFSAEVSGASDARNDIIIRGNSPLGLLWRLNGIEIPNPNHFGALGSTGGPVSMLNNNLLDKSDFLTGAFPAEYGNAIGGVFDLKMRSGNNEKYEFLGQIGFNGFEVGAEGPFKKNKSSFLVNYRYSTLKIFSALDIDIGTGAAVPEYQDLSFRLDFPVKKGRWSVYGLGGNSYVEVLDRETDSTKTNLYLSGKRQDGYYGNSMGVIGVQKTTFFSPTFYSVLNFSASTADQLYKVDSISNADNNPYPSYCNDSRHSKLTTSWNVAKKFSQKNYLKAGVIADMLFFLYRDSALQAGQWQKFSNMDESSWLMQAFVQLQHRFSDRFSLITGVHTQYFVFNRTSSTEPRLAVRWEISGKQSISIAGGFHSQLQPMYAYFQETLLTNGKYIETNRNLEMTKSRHLVLAYDRSLGADMRIKVESYYQELTGIPVERRSTWFSMLNEGAAFGVSNVDSLENKGTGHNYGLELTLEKFYSRGYYFLMTGSVFDSKYKGSDGILRNTAFNGNFILNLLAGREWTFKKRNTFAFNFRTTYAGGKRYIPVDFEESQAAEETKFDFSKAYEDRRKDYFRCDIKIGYRINYERSTHEFSLDIDNVFNTRNIWEEIYDPNSNTVKTQYQLGVFPVPQYRLTF